MSTDKLNEISSDARSILSALRDSQTALRKAAFACNSMADKVADLQRLLRHDHELGMFEIEEPPPADNDHVATGASLFPEGTQP